MAGTMNPSALLAWRNARDAFDRWQEAEAKAQALLVDYQMRIADLSAHFMPQYDNAPLQHCGGTACMRMQVTHRSAATEPHPCPYKQEIGNDSTSLCTCCELCQSECADDI